MLDICPPHAWEQPQARFRCPRVQGVLFLFPERVTLSCASVSCPSGQPCLSWALAGTLGSCFGAVLPCGEAPRWETGGKSTGPIQTSPPS